MRTTTILFLAFSGCAASAPATLPTPPVPDALQTPAGQTLVLEGKAKGVQVYECKTGKDSGQLEWTLTGPDAELYDAAGKLIIKHYAGPTWESTDGSKIVGEVKAKAPSPDPAAIPWLLLSVKSSEGSGALAGVTNVQRLFTTGGKAPADGCTADHTGATVRVDYQATYRFFR